MCILKYRDDLQGTFGAPFILTVYEMLGHTDLEQRHTHISDFNIYNELLITQTYTNAIFSTESC